MYKILLIVILIFGQLGCKKEKIQIPDNSIAVGKKFFGGIVTYILEPGDIGYDSLVVHGLVIAEHDIGDSATFGCKGKGSKSASEIGTGQQNTNTVLSYCNEKGTAAKICDELVLNGYNDWYLPSLEEISKYYLDGYHWTSSSVTPDHAWVYHWGISPASWPFPALPSPDNQLAVKDKFCKVRPFRSF